MRKKAAYKTITIRKKLTNNTDLFALPKNYVLIN